MLRRLLRIVIYALVSLFGLALLMVVAALGLGWALRPPNPLKPPPRGALLENVTLINPDADRRAGQTLVITGDRIASIQPAANVSGHCSGLYVLPGLIDLHVHHPMAQDVPLFEAMYLVHGVTSVRDTGNFDGLILKYRDRIRDGKFPGPRIFACGPLIDGDPPIWRGSSVVRDAAEAEHAVDKIAATGVDCIKAYQNLTADSLSGVERAAARHHLPVIGHVPTAVPFEVHLADVQHLTGVAVLGVPAPGSSSDFVGRFAEGWNNVDRDRLDFIVRTSVDQKIAHTPTLVVWKRMGLLADFQEDYRTSEANRLPGWYADALWRGNPNWTNSYRALEAQIPKMQLAVQMLHQAGVPIHVGTDTLNPFVVPGASMHEEMSLIAGSGISAEQVWALATRGNAAFFSDPKLGTIALGAPADLLVFREDPTTDLSKLETLVAVVADGRLYEKTELDSALEAYRRHFESWLYVRVSRIISALVSLFRK